MKSEFRLEATFLPSPACNCEICRKYCLRPGWWTVHQATDAISQGLANRMMLEIAPDFTFGVISPAFLGCEGSIAINEFSKAGCNFLSNDLCQLHGTKLQPLECQVCHHARPGLGIKCHNEIEKQWNADTGQALVVKWMEEISFWKKLSNGSNAIKRRNS
jgi:hypothetical protein